MEAADRVLAATKAREQAWAERTLAWDALPKNNRIRYQPWGPSKDWTPVEARYVHAYHKWIRTETPLEEAKAVLLNVAATP